MFGTFVAGISFADETAHLAVLQVKKKFVRLRHLGEYKKIKPDDLWFLDSLLIPEGRVIRKVSRAAVAIDQRAAFVHTFPSDSALSTADEQDQIAWELSNFIPDFKPDDYTREKHLLQTRAHRQVSELLVVVYKKSLVESAKAALLKKKISLATVVLNNFGAQTALLQNSPEIRSKMVALVHVAVNRIDVALLNRGRLMAYRCAPVSSEGEMLDSIQGLVNPFPVSDLFFHGAPVTGPLLERVRRQVPWKVSTVNPFKNLRVASSVKDFQSYAGKEHRFAAAIGCALRDR
jgi:Tfp pilus assembly PilM family ATPase